LVDALEDKYGVRPGETTPDDELSVMDARCVGACGLAPIAVIDGEVLGKISVDEMLDKIEKAI
jgi:bidirectional [NiFe] hydrogenase diaphorase subunit